MGNKRIRLFVQQAESLLLIAERKSFFCSGENWQQPGGSVKN